MIPEVTIPGLVNWPQELQNYLDQCQDDGGGTIPFTDQELTTMFEELKAQNREVIYNSSTEDFLPGFKDTRIVNGQQIVKEERLEDCSHILVAQEADRLEHRSVL